MLLALVFFFIFCISMTCFYLALRESPEDRSMEARFALLQTEGPGGLASVAAGLLKDAPAVSGLVAQFLEQQTFTHRLQKLAQQADRPLLPTRFVLSSAVAGLVGFLVGLGVLPGPLFALCAGLACSSIPFLLLRMRAQKRLKDFNKALPDLIDMMGRSLRAGHSLVAAISIVAEQAQEPARTEFAEVFRQQNFGLPLRDALMQLLDRVPSQDLRVLVTGILVQKDTGGNLTQILDRTANVVRERLKLQGDVRVHTAQGRMTGWILCLLPIVMMLLINLINPGYSKALTDDPFGRKLLYVGIVLLGLGAYLIRRIVNGIEI